MLLFCLRPALAVDVGVGVVGDVGGDDKWGKPLYLLNNANYWKYETDSAVTFGYKILNINFVSLNVYSMLCG
ncbi:MAG: hypothetical protein CMM52_17700 [Rhodospirillaceae bacterium]|nr:hypothetical protein [Rhodospirillaceae bacterium]|tara:strand:+ start:36449 stop:36664 length:216 start_codon:yes stop_codon:yes gene_type:complete